MSIVEEYQRDGVVVLRGVVSPSEIEALRRGIDQVIAQPGPRAKVASSGDDPGFFLEDFCRWRDVPEFCEFVHTSALRSLAAELMQSTSVVHFHDHVLVKEPRTRQITPWHQDQPYYDVEGRKNVSFWIPVDPVPRESCLEVWAGSHRGPWYMPRSFLDQQARWFPDGSLDELPDIDIGREDPDPDRRLPIRGWQLDPGDVIAFHMLSVHGARGTIDRRRVFSWRVLGDDMVFVRRPWTTSPDLGAVIGADDGRREGHALSGEWFPQVWPSPS